MQNKIKQNKKIIIKSVFGLVLAVVFICIITLINRTNIAGRIIGFILYFLISSFCIFEFSGILNFKFKNWIRIYLSLATFVTFFLPWDEIINWISNKTLLTINEFIKIQYEFTILNVPGLGYLFLLFMIALPFLFFARKFNKKQVLFYFIFFVIITIITTASKTLLIINVNEVWFLVPLIVGPIICDTFGYFGGLLLGNKIFKNKKLAPKISPNKTIEGAIAGFIVTWSVLFVFFWFMKLDNLHINKVIILTIIPISLPIISILGDLLFSWIKRLTNLKDYANIIPEHGGILDRVDSIALTTFIFSSLFIVL